MNISVEINIDVKGNIAKINNDNFWTFSANEWWRLITPYTPMDTGTLFESVRITPKQIEYYQPYAHRVYVGDYMNFRKDKHPLASARWDEVARATQISKLVSAMQGYANKLIKE